MLFVILMTTIIGGALLKRIREVVFSSSNKGTHGVVNLTAAMIEPFRNKGVSLPGAKTKESTGSFELTP